MMQSTQWTADRINVFLQAFFGTGNDAWPNMDPDYPYKGRTEPFVRVLQDGVDAPVVLPRWDSASQQYAMYAIVRDQADVAKTAELIEAFAGPTYIDCDMERGLRPARLSSDDPIEQAILDFAGERVTFRLTTGQHSHHRQGLTDALLLMQKTSASRPPRLWRVVKPVGRLIAEFDAALAAGGDAASLDLLEQLAAAGGLTATNLAHLKLKRLDRLGVSSKVLDFSSLQDIVHQDPPVPVKRAILNAVYTVALEDTLAARNLEAAKQQLIAHGRVVPQLLSSNPRPYGPQATTVLLLASVILNNASAARRVLTVIEELDQAYQISPLVLNEAAQLASEPVPDTEAPEGTDPAHAPEPATTATPIGSWPALFTSLAEGQVAAKQVIEDQDWSLWPSPAESDALLAQFLDSLNDGAAGELWRAVGSFLDAVGYDEPAPMCAHAFIRNAVLFNRYSPGDLAVLQALMDIALRAAPSAATYSEILSDIGAECSRWIAPERASAALDFVDRLFLAACPDRDARENLCLTLLGPLAAHQSRLSESELAFARRLTQELGIDGFDWATPAAQGDQEDTLAALPPSTLLLYSLDEAVLGRCQEELKQIAPTVKVTTAYDHVGTPQLRQKARSADVVVLATRCAKHAATGFITQHAGDVPIAYADGSGSASLLRAAVDGLRATASEA
ncbi:protein DpdD [Streptomyces microflavus]|uniref:protein DpdD n=1 Tax=Streptomyces microflavus TaxID=1919 RepID=UPI002E304636|nr:protein DpdD [Streptomyces microflavus]